MKLSSKPLKFIILGTLVLMMSCGKKKSGIGYPGGPFGFPPGYIAHYDCPQGRIPNITFSATQAYLGNTTQIQGGLQPTPIGGIPSNSYVGVNLGTKDLIYITKMTDGGRVLGFNISLSLCRSITQNAWGQPIPLIDTSRMPTVTGASPIIITDPTNCPKGTVVQGAVEIFIPPYQIPGTSRPIEGMKTLIPFTTPTCIQ